MANPDPSQTSTLNAEESHATKGLVRLTMACNEKCPFCNVPAEDYARPTPPMEEVLAEVQQFIKRGDRTLTISGGEPTLNRGRLLTLVETARKGGIQFIEVQTNAVLIDAGYASSLAAAGTTSAFVSLLSHKPELHDELAGLPGAYPRCLKGIEHLLDAGIRVALNPVTATSTQDHLADFVEFVAVRFPRIRSISLSAVQPHGRGANNIALMPDYSRLQNSVRRAQQVARENNIELLNPYCGLPLCIGWSNDLPRSVEAIEATAPPDPRGVDNHGNKRHGAPCVDCGLRGRCGGAWHAYWDVRKGSGLNPPWTAQPPWGEPQQLQDLVDGRGSPINTTLNNAGSTSKACRWLWLDAIERADIGSIRSAGVTHIGLDLQVRSIKAASRGLRSLQQTNELVSPQRKIQVHLRILDSLALLSAQQVEDLVQLFKALGVARLTACDPGPHEERISASGIGA
jgi:MoaA/NifB/PqqE/SkfB family radical SAM enzyme